jgi:hypothetical protein
VKVLGIQDKKQRQDFKKEKSSEDKFSGFSFLREFSFVWLWLVAGLTSSVLLTPNYSSQ